MKESDGGDDYTNCIFFLDIAGNEVASYDPDVNISKDGLAFDIAENEEIFGVYGVKDKEDYFTSFGFIVRTKPQQ